ncbi:MAG TPA: hypothetical protein VGM23_17075, partial [Armatimonadota bacterium]
MMDSTTQQGQSFSEIGKFLRRILVIALPITAGHFLLSVWYLTAMYPRLRVLDLPSNGWEALLAQVTVKVPLASLHIYPPQKGEMLHSMIVQCLLFGGIVTVPLAVALTKRFQQNTLGRITRWVTVSLTAIITVNIFLCVITMWGFINFREQAVSSVDMQSLHEKVIWLN